MEDILLTYGPLGLWTAWLLYEKQKLLAAVQKVLTENTEALNRICAKLK